jgi:ribosomal protein S12 methylthiotransferase
VLDRINAWRAGCPDLALRSTFIVGFPGETEDDFQYLLDWVREARIERAGCFKYEPVDGARANELPGAVPDEVKQERWHRFMEVQSQVSAEIMATRVGREIDVLVDTIDEDEDGVEAVGRSVWDAPEIDGNVFLPGESSLKPGDMVRARVVEAEEYDLIGELV